MAKKIRLGYDILSKRAIETENGVNIDDALRRKDQQIADINNSITNIEGDIADIKSNFDYVVIDPVNGDDANDGLTRNTPVKYLKRAVEIYVEKFGGAKVIAHVINTECPENYQESETWIQPNNSSNLFLDDISGVDEVVIINDGGLCLSEVDYQTVPGQATGVAYPKYRLTITSERSIGFIFSTNPIMNRIKAVSTTGDIYIAGSYLQTLENLTLVCQNGTLYNSFGPRFNAMLDTETEYYFDAMFFYGSSCVAGNNATLISRNTLVNGMNPPSGKESNIFPQFLLRGNLTILSAGSIRETDNSYTTSYVGGKLTIKSMGDETGSLCLWDIQGHCADGSGSNNQGDPTIMSYPDIDIDWNGDVYLGYYVNTSPAVRPRVLSRKFRLKCNWLAFPNDGVDIFSQSDLTIELANGDITAYSQNGHLYADGTVRIISDNALKFCHKIHADNVDIVAGGVPEYKPAIKTTNSGNGTADKNRTVIGDVNARITNAIEYFVGTDGNISTSTSDASYSVRCTGDFCDYGYSFQNGKATVSLDVAGSATISYNSSMMVKRLVLHSNHAYFTNSGIYVTSFDIRCGKIQVTNGGNIRQWFSYGGGGWVIGYKNGGQVYNGGSWGYNEEDSSVIDCESLEFLNTSFSQGWIRPAYTSDSNGKPVKHDIDIRIGVLIPYRATDGYYTGGSEYCALIGQPFQGTPNSAITGTIGDVMMGNGQFMSEYKHDWFMYQGDMNYYEQYSWNGCTISCHFLKEISHNVYIDFNQGNDAYDGLSRATPVRTMYGLRRTCNRFINDPGNNYVLTIHVMSSTTGSYDSTNVSFGPNCSLDFYDNLTRTYYNNGLCYNWYAAKYLDDNKATLLPEGWRVPTQSDFGMLFNAGGNGAVELKSRDWTGNDTYGLSFIPCGEGYSTYWNDKFACSAWSSDEYNGNQAYAMMLYHNSGYTSHTDKVGYNPIRLVRTAPSSAVSGDTGTVTIGGTTYNTIVVNGLEWITRNLDYQFTGGTFRDGSTDNRIDGTTTPQYAYYKYYASGSYSLPFGYCQYVEIVSETPFLSIFIDSLWANVCKISGFRNVYLADPRIGCLDIETSEDIKYVCGYRGSTGHGQSNEYYPNVLTAKCRNFTGIGFHSAYSTYIEAYENFYCKSGDYQFGSSAQPYFYGSIKIHAGYISIGENTALINNMNMILESASRIEFSSPPTVQSGTLKMISHGAGGSSYYFQSINSANILIDAPNAEVNISYLGYYSTVGSGGTFRVNCREFSCSQSIFNSDVFINASRAIYMSSGYIYGDNATQVRLSAQYMYPPSVYGGQYKLDCTELSSTIPVRNSGPRSGNTEVYVEAEHTSGPVFTLLGGQNTHCWLEAKITDLSGSFISNQVGSDSHNGLYFQKCKGVIDFYTGNDPDNDLADWRTPIVADADFELIVLNRTKQLVAGQGINISDTGDNVVISSDPKSTIVQKPVTIDNGTATVQLTLNRYNVITGIDRTVTDLVIDFPVESTATLLTEIGFEFYLDGLAQDLNSVTFTNSTEQFSSVVPDEFTAGHIYQGVLVNRCITLVEYDRPDPDVMEINGVKYRTVKIGDQTWMAENVADTTTGVWYDNDQSTYEPLGYGKLYTQSEAESIAGSVSGWHLPTKADYETLLTTVGGASQYNKLKSTTGWIGDNNGTNESGFNGYPAGYGWNTGSGFSDVTKYSYFRTATAGDTSGNHKFFQLCPSSDAAFQEMYDTSKLSVRLVKDSEAQGPVIDGRTYQTVVMPDGKEWLAENLAADSFGGVWFNNDRANYEIYGKYYTSAEAASISVPGWHVATWADWDGLWTALGGDYTKIKSTTLWTYVPGTDDFGFTLLPCGEGYVYFSDMSTVYFWNAGSMALLHATNPPSGDNSSWAYIDDSDWYIRSYNDTSGTLVLPVRLVKDSV